MASRNKPSRILVFRGGALGDFMLTLPAIAALRQSRPGAYIELVGYEKRALLALVTGLVDHVRSLDDARMALYFQAEEKLPRSEREYIRSFDLVVSYLHDPAGVLCRNLKEAGAKQIIAASPIVKEGHAADHFWKAIKDVVRDKVMQRVVPKSLSYFIKCDNTLALPREQFPSWRADLKECPQILLEWPRSLKEGARRRLAAEIGNKQTIVIHPGSGSPAKNWPAKNFSLLAKKIKAKTKFEPLVIGGEADGDTISVMRSLLPNFIFFENKPLDEITSMLSVSGGYVGNDSGITHLAAALGVPVVAIFGPTAPSIWAPRGKHVSVIRNRNGCLAAVRVEEVYKKLLQSF